MEMDKTTITEDSEKMDISIDDESSKEDDSALSELPELFDKSCDTQVAETTILNAGDEEKKNTENDNNNSEHEKNAIKEYFQKKKRGRKNRKKKAQEKSTPVSAVMDHYKPSVAQLREWGFASEKEMEGIVSQTSLEQEEKKRVRALKDLGILDEEIKMLQQME